MKPGTHKIEPTADAPKPVFLEFYSTPDRTHLRPRTDQLTRVSEDLARVLTVTKAGNEERPLFDLAMDRLLAARRGNPGAQALDDRVSRSMGTESPPPPGTFDKAMAEDDLRDLDKALRAIERGARTVLDVTAAWQPRRPDPKAKLEAEIANTAEPLCSHCTRWRAPGNACLVFRTGDVGGRLKRKIALCEWCYDVVRTTAELGDARLPRHAEVERNEQGLRVRFAAPAK